MEIAETLRSIAYPLARTAAYCANALLFGLAPVVRLVLRPVLASTDAAALSAGRRRVGSRLEGLVQAALVASAITTIVILILQASLVSELAGGDVDVESIQAALETSFGRWIGLRLILLCGLALVLVRKVGELSMATDHGAGRLWWITWLVLAGAVLVTSPLSGHAAVAEPIPGSLANDALHLIAGSVWFAGIVVLCVVLPDVWAGLPAPERLAMLTPAVDRFATVALISIAVAGVTGVLNSFLQVGALNDLVDTGYGRTLVVKLSLFVGLLGFGAVNHFVVRGSLVRALKEGNPTSASSLFRKTIAAELVIALGIMGATGLLVGLETTRL
jgi:putative copper export protein